jgi:hypothetical protein
MTHVSRVGDDAERSDEEERRAVSPVGDDAEQESDVGARPLAAVRLGVPPPACGGEERRA